MLPEVYAPVACPLPRLLLCTWCVPALLLQPLAGGCMLLMPLL